MNPPPGVESAIADTLRGDRDAFRRVVEAYAPSLRSYLAAQVYRLDDVDDLAQEVFIAAYRNLHTYRRGSSFPAWLRGIAKKEVLMYFRSSARRASALDRFREEVAGVAGADLDRATAEDRAEVVEQLLRCVARLPEKLRRVVRAGLDGSSAATQAAELGTSVTAVYNLHYRANQLLRACLQKGTG